jgi:hypothetical protein
MATTIEARGAKVAEVGKLRGCKTKRKKHKKVQTVVSS